MDTYKKTTLDYLIRVIRAIAGGEHFKFSTAAYDGGLNFYVKRIEFLGERYVAVVAPSISEKAFLVYDLDLELKIWEDGFKEYLETIDAEIGLDPDGCPYIEAAELDRFIALHPDIAPTEDEAWDWDEDEDEDEEDESTDGDKVVCAGGWSLLRSYYQPARESKGGGFELPKGMISFLVLASEKACGRYVESLGQKRDGFVPVKMLPGDVQGPTLMYTDSGKWCAAQLLALKVVSANASGSDEALVLFPDLADEGTEALLDDAKAALDVLGAFGHIESIEYIPEENLTEDDLKAIIGYVVPTELLGE